MTTTTSTVELLATLLAYPQADFGPAVAVCAGGQADADAEIAALLKQFAERLPSRELTDLEELYVQTFDMNPDKALELGWHLFGETYERGSFLVQMRGLLREYGVEESSELPDHLAHVMQLLGRMEKSAADAFAVKFVIPGVAKLRKAFTETDHPYFHCIAALERVVQTAYSGAQGA